MKSILNSFKIKDNLNSDIWIEENNEYKLKPEIRRQLIKIANMFVDFINVESLEIEDITITGSLANYNWSEFSDIDLHILVDFTKIAEDTELVNNFLRAKKSLFNDKFDFETKGHEVEVYAQSVNEVHRSSGVYSVLYADWVVEPKPIPKDIIDTKIIKEKAQTIIELIKDIQETKENDPTELRKRISKLKDKIGNYRKCGLETGGEFSIENLVFKYLRRTGWLTVLSELQVNALSDLLTVKEANFNN